MVAEIPRQPPVNGGPRLVLHADVDAFFCQVGAKAARSQLGAVGKRAPCPFALWPPAVPRRPLLPARLPSPVPCTSCSQYAYRAPLAPFAPVHGPSHGRPCTTADPHSAHSPVIPCPCDPPGPHHTRVEALCTVLGISTHTDRALNHAGRLGLCAGPRRLTHAPLTHTCGGPAQHLQTGSPPFTHACGGPALAA